jgi:spore coat polysaccharide biosynthesis predicted glycosyltransferase SpsG
MNRDPVLFRVDGTKQTGWERFNRCLTYSAALQRRRRQAFFRSQLDPASLALPIKRIGNEWLEADDPVATGLDLSETIQEIRRIRPAAVIVDSPNISEEYLSEVSAAGPLVVSIEHEPTIRYPSALVINPMLEPGRDSFDFVPGTQLLLGRRYAIVRPEIRRVRQIRAQEPLAPFRVLIALGDDDKGQVLELVRKLIALSKLERIDVAVRSYHPLLQQLNQLQAAHPKRLELAMEPAEVTAKISRCHFAISSGDSWSLELACVGVPQLVIVQSEFHWPTARRLEDEGVAVCLGENANVSTSVLKQSIHDILDDSWERQAMSRCGRKLIDGRGPDRLVTALEVLLHPSRLIDFHEPENFAA